MTPEEVEFSTNGVARIDPGTPGDRRMFGGEIVGNVGAFDWHGKAFLAKFYYRENSLMSVTLEPENMSECSDILVGLESTYGVPTSRDESNPDGRPNGQRRVIDWGDDGSGNWIRYLSLTRSMCSVNFSQIRN